MLSKRTGSRPLLHGDINQRKHLRAAEREPGPPNILVKVQILLRQQKIDRLLPLVNLEETKT